MQDSSVKKSHTGLIVVVMLMIGFLIGGAGSYYYFEVMNKNNDSAVEKEKVVEKVEKRDISKDSVYVKELIDSYDVSYISNAEVYDKLYLKEKTIPLDLDEEYLRSCVMKKSNHSLNQYLDVDGVEYQNNVKKLFGNQVTLDNKSYEIASGCTKYSYENGRYSLVPVLGGCGGTSASKMERVITKATKYASKLEVEVAVAIVDGGSNKVYTGINKDEVVGVSADTFNIQGNIDKLAKYKYTFNYDDENDGYYFYSIELVK